MKHPLSRFAPSPSLTLLRNLGGDAPSARKRSAAYAAWRPLHGSTRLGCVHIAGCEHDQYQ